MAPPGSTARRPDEVAVFPNVVAIKRVQLTLRRGLRAMAGLRRARPPGASTAFAGLRDYVRGDDVRRVSWTATARRDRPVVVEVEAERGQQVMIALDCGRLMTAPAGELDKLDHAVNAALMLAWVAHAYGDRVGLMTFDDRVTGFIKPERGSSQIRRLTEALYAIKSDYVEPDFGHAFTHLALRLGRRSMVVVLTDVQDPEASKELVAHCLRLAARHLVLVVAMSDPAVLSARDQPITTLVARVRVGGGRGVRRQPPRELRAAAARWSAGARRRGRQPQPGAGRALPRAQGAGASVTLRRRPASSR